MNDEPERQEPVRYWLEKAGLALAAARRERAAGDLALALNRVYYACFYAVCAVLAAEGMAYGKHSAVRAALHQHLVKERRIPADWGAFYNRAFDDRQEADYEASAEFDDSTVGDRIAKAAEFVAVMERLLGV
jgi:uncharacterized protein (UPF0332 family)